MADLKKGGHYFVIHAAFPDAGTPIQQGDAEQSRDAAANGHRNCLPEPTYEELSLPVIVSAGVLTASAQPPGGMKELGCLGQQTSSMGRDANARTDDWHDLCRLDPPVGVFA